MLSIEECWTILTAILSYINPPIYYLKKQPTACQFEVNESFAFLKPCSILHPMLYTFEASHI